MDLQLIWDMELAYKTTFSHADERPWGYLFCDPDNPRYWDANHAWVRRAPADPNSLIHEVITFYLQRSIMPQFYLFDVEGQVDFLHSLSAHGFKTEVSRDPVQRWDGTIAQTRPLPGVVIEEVGERNYEDALAVQGSIEEFGGPSRAQAFMREYQSGQSRYYLLRSSGIPVATACLFRYGESARLESVATLKKYRRMGFARRLISHFQELASQTGLESLFVLPNGEDAENVYQKCGFVTVGAVETGHAHML